MERWKQTLRATLARNIAGLRLAPDKAARLLESEFLAAVEAMETATPFGPSPESDELETP